MHVLAKTSLILFIDKCKHAWLPRLLEIHFIKLEETINHLSLFIVTLEICIIHPLLEVRNIILLL